MSTDSAPRSRVQKSTTVRSSSVVQIARSVIWGLDALSPELAARATFRLFATPRRHRRPPREERLLAQARPWTFQSAAGPLQAWSWGAGPVALLVHGWEGRGAQLGAFVAPLLRAGYQVVTFDGPGHGASGRGLGSAPHLATAIVDIAREVDVKVVIAHSMGALATSMAMRRGAQFDRLVYLAPAGAPDRGLAIAQGMLGLHDRQIERLKEDMRRAEPMTWRELQGGAVPPNAATPLLVVHDREDPEVEFEVACAIVTQWRGAELVATEGLGHNRVMWEPDVVRRAVSFATLTTAAERELRDPWRRFLYGGDQLELAG